MASHNASILSYDPAIFEHGGSLLVHAVFPHAWQLRSKGGQILSVVAARWNGPMTMRVAALPGRYGMSRGMAATLTEDRLEVGATVVSFDGARPWRPLAERFEPLDPARLRDDLPAVRRALQTAARGGLALGDGGSTFEGGERVGHEGRGYECRQPAWLAHGSDEMAGMGAALIRQEAEAVTRHAFGLLGLGPGLTPSGDDVLCGLIAGLSMLGGRSARHRARCSGARAALAAGITAEASRRTTSLSATLLRSAVRGVAVEPLLHVLGTVGSGHRVNGVEEVLMLGHSSGSDMLAGAIMAGTALVRWEEVFGPAMVGSR